MIIDKKVKVKITRRNIVHYIKFFKDISLKDIILVNTSTQLIKSSNLKINVSCDICNTIRFIKYQAYIYLQNTLMNLIK